MEAILKEVVMGTKLTGDQYKTAFKKMAEVQRQLGQTEYPYNPVWLLAALQCIVEGRFESLVEMPQQKQEVYVVTIDYTKDVEQLVASGRFGYVHHEINGRNFPLTGEGVVEVSLVLVHLDRGGLDTSEVEAELDKMGLRPATFEELVAFGATYPYVQEGKHPRIVALGSSWFDELYDDIYVPYLSGYLYAEETRVLSLFSCDTCHEKTRFLAVPK